MAQNAACPDRFLNPTITNELFVTKEKIDFSRKKKGRVELSDLAARNIQRGSDHGISNYNNYRKWAGVPDLMQFNIVPCYECCVCVINKRRCEKNEEEQGVWRCANRNNRKVLCT